MHQKTSHVQKTLKISESEDSLVQMYQKTSSAKENIECTMYQKTSHVAENIEYIRK